ncbi:hypothetical protein L6452_04432 [Arctium lappa]|uniref:Uncharacterized protein n=1 Tax=Arctium lappa TaxID=4217 RepID=A0ACB9FQ41_ARCLA|nr:hypothetical protein L6452_04432 [Arctium lappa]
MAPPLSEVCVPDFKMDCCDKEKDESAEVLAIPLPSIISKPLEHFKNKGFGDVEMMNISNETHGCPSFSNGSKVGNDMEKPRRKKDGAPISGVDTVSMHGKQVFYFGLDLMAAEPVKSVSMENCEGNGFRLLDDLQRMTNEKNKVVLLHGNDPTVISLKAHSSDFFGNLQCLENREDTVSFFKNHKVGSDGDLSMEDHLSQKLSPSTRSLAPAKGENLESNFPSFEVMCGESQTSEGRKSDDGQAIGLVLVDANMEGNRGVQMSVVSGSRVQDQEKINDSAMDFSFHSPHDFRIRPGFSKDGTCGLVSFMGNDLILEGKYTHHVEHVSTSSKFESAVLEEVEILGSNFNAFGGSQNSIIESHVLDLQNHLNGGPKSLGDGPRGTFFSYGNGGLNDLDNAIKGPRESDFSSSGPVFDNNDGPKGGPASSLIGPSATLNFSNNGPQDTLLGVGLGTSLFGQAQIQKSKSSTGLPSILGKHPSGPEAEADSDDGDTDECSHCKIFGHSDSSCMVAIAKTAATNSSPTVQSNVNGVDKDGFQTVNRKSSPKAHAFSSNGRVEKQKKDKHPAAESEKHATDKLKTKSKVPSRTEFRKVQKKNPPPPFITPPLQSPPPKGSNLKITSPSPNPKIPKPQPQTKTKVVSHSSNRFAILSNPSLPKDLGSSSLSSPVHQASFEPMDVSFEQDDLLNEDDVIEVESDDGATASFLTHDHIPPQVDPLPTPEPERMDSTPSLVSL